MDVKLPIGIDDFREVRERGYLYVDKSLLIDELLESSLKVTLITRPRRFGKTLALSMIKYFLDIKDREKSRKLFTDLEIEKSKYIEEQGKYPVIYLSFKDIKVENWGICLEKIRILCGELFEKYQFVIEKLDKKRKMKFERILMEECSYSELENALKLLTDILYEYYGQKTVLLIDEYDTPLITAYRKDYFEQALSFFRNFYGAALKGNESLHLSVMTGVLRIAREGVFSGLNNMNVFTVFNERYSRYFGFTEKETDTLLADCKEKEKAKEWYLGYNFGREKCANPWSLLKYLNEKQFKLYWTNSSDDEILKGVCGSLDDEFYEDFENLFSGKKILKYIAEDTIFNKLDDRGKIWENLLYNGYLTTAGQRDEHEYYLTVPDKELRTFFKYILLDDFTQGNIIIFNEMINVLKKIKAENIRDFEHLLQKIFNYSDLCYKVGCQEKFSEKLALGLILALYEDYSAEIKKSDDIISKIRIIPKKEGSRECVLNFFKDDIDVIEEVSTEKKIVLNIIFSKKKISVKSI